MAKIVPQAHKAEIVERIERAHEGFVQTLIELAGICRADAIAVKDMYIKDKAAKVDTWMATIRVVHGRLLDPAIIRRAADVATGREIL